MAKHKPKLNFDDAKFKKGQIIKLPKETIEIKKIYKVQNKTSLIWYYCYDIKSNAYGKSFVFEIWLENLIQVSNKPYPNYFKDFY